MKTPIASLGAALLLTIAPSANGALISPTTAITTMGSGIGTNLINTINGVGLSSLSLTATHDGTSPFNSWVSGPSLFAGDITFDLGGVFSIQGLSFWNQNDGGPGGVGSTGIQNLVISSSVDNVTFTPIVGAPTAFAQDMNVVGTAQQFAFGAVTASHVRFSISSNYGDPAQTGFAEVQFDKAAAASVADSGSTLALLGTTVLGIAAMKRGKFLI